MIRAIWGSSKSTVKALKWAFCLALMEGWLKQPTVLWSVHAVELRLCDVMACMYIYTLDEDLMFKPTYPHSRIG